MVEGIPSVAISGRVGFGGDAGISGCGYQVPWRRVARLAG